MKAIFTYQRHMSEPHTVEEARPTTQAEVVSYLEDSWDQAVLLVAESGILVAVWRDHDDDVCSFMWQSHEDLVEELDAEGGNLTATEAVQEALAYHV